MTTEHPLKPLPSGNILLVGIKASNLDDEIKSHPRVVLWDSQNENWTGKDIPYNVRAVFMTRFISHNTSTRLLSECRKRQILIFNPDGTGSIVKQVRELLTIGTVQPTTTPTLEEYVKMTNESQHGKLKPLIQFIDYTKTDRANAEFLMLKAKEMRIETTVNSLDNLVGRTRRKLNQTAVPKSIQSKVDVSVEILDNMIKELTDMRQFLIATVDENRVLKARMADLKKLMGDI